MRSVALVSVGGAPGVTTLACAAAAAAPAEQPLLVIEAAPSGGSVAGRWHLDVHEQVATSTRLAMDGVVGHVDLWDAAHHPWLSASRVIPAHPSAVVMHQAQVGRWLASRLPASRPALVDAGRLDGSPDQLALFGAVDAVWVVLDPIIEQVTAAKAVARWLDRVGPVELLAREPAGDPAREAAGAVAGVLGWSVAATVPEDVPAARALCGLSPPRRNLGRSPLLRTGRLLAERLAPAEVPA